MRALPECVGHLADAIRSHRDLLELLQVTSTRLGGGSVLAAHWNHHRRSTDLDLMMKAEAFDMHQDMIEEMLSEIPSEKHEDIVIPEKGRIVIAVRGVYGMMGDIEIVRDELGDSMRTAHTAQSGPLVKQVGLDAEAKIYILAKKFHRMMRGHLERDHYDVLWSAYNDRPTLIAAVTSFIDPETLQNIAMSAQRGPDALFKDQNKPVLDPKAPEWKSVLADVWQAIDTFTTQPGRADMALPKLKGAGGGRKGRIHGG